MISLSFATFLGLAAQNPNNQVTGNPFLGFIFLGVLDYLIISLILGAVL